MRATLLTLNTGWRHNPRLPQRSPRLRPLRTRSAPLRDELGRGHRQRTNKRPDRHGRGSARLPAVPNGLQLPERNRLAHHGPVPRRPGPGNPPEHGFGAVRRHRRVAVQAHRGDRRGRVLSRAEAVRRPALLALLADVRLPVQHAGIRGGLDELDRRGGASAGPQGRRALHRGGVRVRKPGLRGAVARVSRPERADGHPVDPLCVFRRSERRGAAGVAALRRWRGWAQFGAAERVARRVLCRGGYVPAGWAGVSDAVGKEATCVRESGG